ncbi:hypothetical protein TRFO_27439 [Tritrichomonas foetus]|uniref:Uncharacterized protein n=1 Tax=Tritrichomonas foetus TaxID=1144522 RepID=A0A1J4K1V4_9EUKA|nr:hypothetical protein TRFO_27439 [Tritrichomonas foetus]|eukprot:OHT04938.1 hypothetical protein TRFO_27439 [Tritrichomonas foetus]
MYQTRYEARKKAISKFKKTKTLKHSDYGKSKSAKAPNIPPDPFQGMLDFKEHLKSALADSIPSLSKARINDVTSAALLCYRQWDSLINSQKKMIEQATMMHKQNYFQTMQMNIQMNGENNYHDDESDNYSEGSYSDFYLESE